MPKIGLLLFFVGLTATFSAKANSTKHDFLPQLIELNKYWDNNSFSLLNYPLPKTEAELIQLHLNSVIENLTSAESNPFHES